MNTSVSSHSVRAVSLGFTVLTLAIVVSAQPVPRRLTGQAVLTPMLMVIIMITGDFLSMSLATDRVRTSETPNSWEIGKITAAGLILGLFFLAFCTGILAIGKFEMHYPTDTLRTLTAIVLVYGSQSIKYAVRDRRHFWGLRPTKWLGRIDIYTLQRGAELLEWRYGKPVRVERGSVGADEGFSSWAPRACGTDCGR